MSLPNLIPLLSLLQLFQLASNQRGVESSTVLKVPRAQLNDLSLSLIPAAFNSQTNCAMGQSGLCVTRTSASLFSDHSVLMHHHVYLHFISPICHGAHYMRPTLQIFENGSNVKLNFTYFSLPAF